MADEKSRITIELWIEETGAILDLFAPDTFDRFLQDICTLFPSVRVKDIPLYYQFLYITRYEIQKSFHTEASYLVALENATEKGKLSVTCAKIKNTLVGEV
jgi:hypothetical protein